MIIGDARCVGEIIELKGRIPLWGLAYAAQERDSPMPDRGYDVEMDRIVTEQRLVTVSGSPETRAVD